MVPRGGIEPSLIRLTAHHFLYHHFLVYLPVDPALSSASEGATLCRYTQVVCLSCATQTPPPPAPSKRDQVVDRSAKAIQDDGRATELSAAGELIKIPWRRWVTIPTALTQPR